MAESRDGHVVPDLDEPRLEAALCRPLARVPDHSDAYDYRGPFEPFAYARPFGVTTASRTGALRLGRCGTARARTLDSCDYGSATPNLSAGLITWASLPSRSRTPALPARVHLPRLRDGRRFTWRMPETPVVAHTARRIWLTRGGRLFTARLPR